MLEPNIKSYSETKYGFEVFGCDFMITDDNLVKLIEINAGTFVFPGNLNVTGNLERCVF